MRQSVYVQRERFFYYDIETKIKDNTKQVLIENLQAPNFKDIGDIISEVKATGIELNMFGRKRRNSVFDTLLETIILDEKSSEKLDQHLGEVEQLNELLVQSNKKIYRYLNNSMLRKEHIIAAFLVFLETQLEWHADIENILVDVEGVTNGFDYLVSCSGNILGYLLYELRDSKSDGKNCNFKIDDIEYMNGFLKQYADRDNLMDAIENWKYSEIEIIDFNNVKKIKFIDEGFDTSVIVSNFRSKAYSRSLTQKYLEEKFGSEQRALKQGLPDYMLDYVQLREFERIFGTNNDKKLILNIELYKWREAILFIKYEASKFLRKQQSKNNRGNLLSLRAYCMCESLFFWRRKMMRYVENLEKEEAEFIIKRLTFSMSTKDLIDAPFINIDGELAIVPSLAKEIDITSALLSSFAVLEESNEGGLNFKGDVFEERFQKKLQQILGVKVARLYRKKDTVGEWDIDLAFILDHQLFMLELKSLNQPYTYKDHARTNSKIIKAINQVKRNAKFFEDNLDIVRDKLGKASDYSINSIQKIVVTSSTLGEAGLYDDVFVVDESAFTAFLLRNEPSISLKYGGVIESFSSSEYSYYEGEVTAKKLIQFLQEVPSVRLMRGQLKIESDNSGDIEYIRQKKVISDFLNASHLDISEIRKVYHKIDVKNFVNTPKPIYNKYKIFKNKTEK
ncbi:nuclease-related domain-containing protein [Listeria newyorkensis]|uniref:NERD domain-containing protein n=1 Tax=Listeria newyorkensis TaxID=1497681 RepID=A0A841YYS4_9LIST|nr:nuclease-related domain-containing protein [Listeria newyorkensis]MBC1458570.1 hypothetical protein [Listeria newyorkensis]